ncbi:hypothetical protein CAP35_08890 [Chitinophagaceae bacterium IBVUCB1]|nr:hypothetical protein CAP35_08890 [Chitinophagaceae bacterium IBVUCB1]
MVKSILTIIVLMIGLNLHAQVTKIQFINNCPDVVNQNLDIWLNGNKIHASLPFRQSTAFYSVNISTPTEIGIAPQNSMTVADTFLSKTITFVASPTYYIVVINGTRNSAGYAPFKKISVDVISGAEEAASVAGNIDLTFAHGATDGLTYDYRTGLQVLANDLSYATYKTGYQSFAPNDIKIRLTNPNGSVLYGTYEAQLSSPFFASQAGVVIASGFVNPGSNNNGASFGLWLALGSGGPMIELPTTTPEPISRVQFIHNCADTTADTVDVYMNGTKIADDFRFRNATAFMDVMGKVPTAIAVAPRTSTSAASAFYTTNFTFDSLGTHIITANGIQSATGYTPKPPFKLTKFDNGREMAANASNIDILFMQGSTDEGNVTTNSDAVFTNIAYDNYSTGYVSFTNTASGSINIGSTTLPVAGTYIMSPIANITGKAITLVNTGFKDSTKNSNGPTSWFYYALPGGGALIKVNKVFHFSVSSVNDNNDITIYPNPTNNSLHINTDKKINSTTIFNIAGSAIMETKSIRNNTIDVSKLAAGTYFIQLQTNEGSFIKTFIKQ